LLLAYVPGCAHFAIALFSAAEHVLEGTIKLGGQDHFYLETNASIVIPTENDEYTLISSTQAPDKHHVCLVLGGGRNDCASFTLLLCVLVWCAFSCLRLPGILTMQQCFLV